VTPNINRPIRHHRPTPIRPNPNPTNRPIPSCRRSIRHLILIDRPRGRAAPLCCLAQVLPGFLSVDKKPADDGKRLWSPDGYLRLNREADARGSVACTCTDECRNCKGECGCEACSLAWLIHQDDQALWDENGDLVSVGDSGAAWHSVADPRQLRLRFHAEDN
jgi:hypothetical protein